MRRYFLIVLAAFGSLSVNAFARETVNVCLPRFREEFLMLALVTAADRGEFEKQNLDVKTLEQPFLEDEARETNGVLTGLLYGDQGVMRRVSEGTECMFGASVVERFLIGPIGEYRDKTMPVLASMYGEGYDTNLIVSKNSKIKTIKDLKGKKVRLGQLPTHVAMARMLKENGMQMTDISVDVSDPVDVLAKLDSGELAAAITYVPTMPYMLASGKVRVLKQGVVKSHVGSAIPHSLIIVNRDYAIAKADTVRRFAAAMDAAAEYLRKNPEQVMYTYQRHAQKFGSPQGWTIQKPIVEKAASLVGSVNPVNLFGGTEQSRKGLIEASRIYGEAIVSVGYEKQVNNLTRWLSGQAPGERKVTSL